MNLNIEKSTRKILESFEINQAPVPIEEMVEKLGIVVSYASSNKYSGMLKRKADDVVLMGLNNGESFNRQRFTMAHELGHFYLHNSKTTFVDDKVTVDYRDHKFKKSDGSKEMEANAFAATLLMPKDWVEKDFRIIVRDKKVFIDEHLFALANKYEVSKEAMKYRLINLGLIRL